MKKALVLFTGINFSHDMAEKAVTWAARNKTSLEALFLKARKEKEEGYGFPSDLDAAEKLKDRRDAEKDDLDLIHDYEEILNDLGNENKVSVSTDILTDPTVEDVLQKTKEAAIVFVDATYDPEDVLSPKDFTLEELKRRSAAPVEVVRES